MAVAAIEQEQVEDPICWCCGSKFSDEDLVRLGNHPEVGVCAPVVPSGCTGARRLQRRRRGGAPRLLSWSTGSTLPGAE